MLFAREFGWTTDDMNRLYRSEIPAIVAALKRQRHVEQSVEQHEHWAFLAAIITNGVSRLSASLAGGRRRPEMKKPQDFLTKETWAMLQKLYEAGKGKAQSAKITDWTSQIEDAKVKGLKGPW